MSGNRDTLGYLSPAQFDAELASQFTDKRSRNRLHLKLR